MGKTRKDRKDRFDHEEGRKKKKKTYRRTNKHRWKQFENTSADEVYSTYEQDYEDLVEDDQ